MTTAEINLPDGTKITIDGSVEDIMKIQQTFSLGSSAKDNQSEIDKSRNIRKKKTNQSGPLGRIRVLIGKDFFKEKRTIDEVKKTLQERAIFYKTSDLSPSLIRLVKGGELRRLKEEGQWRYVNS